MELSTQLYLALLTIVAIGRLIELRHSRRNQQQLAAAGAKKSPEPGYFWMVALHTGMLAGCGLEVVLFNRPWIPAVGLVALAFFLAANITRWWVIRTLGPRWNVEVMSSSLGIVAEGPYKWVRHPNYSAVFVEMLALPLIHSAWISATLGTVLHLLVLRNRVALEESVMMQDSAWRMAFAHRPRFIP